VPVGRQWDCAGGTSDDQGKWLVENHRVDPDVLLENDPASASAGKDVQLDKAIELLLSQITAKPYAFPPVPAHPVR
jgi:tricorn protease